MTTPRKLTKLDFSIPCKELALYLLGKTLVRKLEDGSILKGIIVETESYLGGEDKASHSYNGRQTPGNAPMYMEAGTAYVYMTYGMYYCFNISSIEPGAAVLLRALHPVKGLELMQEIRTSKSKRVKQKVLKENELCNGPSKLCMSLNITKESCNKINLCESDVLWLEEELLENECRNENNVKQIVHTSRIGIASAGVEWAEKPLRFYLLGNPSVSKRDKKAEAALIND